MKCRLCSEEMVVTKWNSAGNIAYCDNSKCPRWHQPYAAGEAEITPAKNTCSRKEPNPDSHKYRRPTRKEQKEAKDREASSKLEQQE